MKHLSSIEISSDSLLNNLHEFQKQLPTSTKIAAVVKANAYGHGLREVVSVLDKKVDYFQVDDFLEYQELRKYSDTHCLILGYVGISELELISDYSNTILGIYDTQRLLTLSEIGKKRGESIAIHIKIDALLGRQGLLLEELPAFLESSRKLSNISIEGIYMHFSNIEDTDDLSHAQLQLDYYKKAIEIFGEFGYRKLIKHHSATSGVLTQQYKLQEEDIVRLGIGLYGLWPSESLKMNYRKKYNLKPALRWVSHVVQVKKLPAHFPVGYGLTYITNSSTSIAIIPQGYSDGYDRELSNRGEVLIKGKRCKVLGRIAMNMFAVDISGIEKVAPEEEVVLLGIQEGGKITAEELADRTGTINYEVIARLNSLLPRVIR